MSERGFQRFAASAAVVVGVATLLYGLVFLFVLTGNRMGNLVARPRGVVHDPHDALRRPLAVPPSHRSNSRRGG
jgi:hypothetical protein